LSKYKSILVVAIAITAIASYVIPFNGIMIARPATGQTPGEGGPYGAAGPCEADDNTPTPGCADIGLPQHAPCEADDTTSSDAACSPLPGTTPGTTPGAGPCEADDSTPTPGCTPAGAPGATAASPPLTPGATPNTGETDTGTTPPVTTLRHRRN
jgi:hypothetical protein